VFVIEKPDDILLTATDPATKAAMVAYEEVARENRAAMAALGRAPNRIAYTGADLFECAACYVFGLARNHGYQDANKRTAYMSGWTFLRLSGWSARAAPNDVVRLMLDVATDIADEAAIAAWLRARAVPPPAALA